MRIKFHCENNLHIRDANLYIYRNFFIIRIAEKRIRMR